VTAPVPSALLDQLLEFIGGGEDLQGMALRAEIMRVAAGLRGAVAQERLMEMVDAEIQRRRLARARAGPTLH
jgi:hypothetical protein